MTILTRLASVLALCAFFVTVACSQKSEAPQALVDSEIESLEARAERVEIIRDNFGVPHIYGVTDADAVFGMIYAQAEDDFPRIERNYIWATGRLAEIAGEGALYSDLRARLFMTIDEARDAYEAAPDWLQELCAAFADGLNYYLLTHPEVVPKLLTRFEPWMPMFFSEGSIGGDIEQIPLDGIRQFYGGNRRNDDNLDQQAAMPDIIEPSGSNGFAIAGGHLCVWPARPRRVHRVSTAFSSRHHRA